ncbi:DUF3421 domain containing protein [Asbolus verrucosus]|uniref:DUF3421 domain containing protein n=1 Tax=Asbolus verrucosus TaxID=1661398 RepID=A0A482V1E1_ASBVE|nr:DUF3421 domain containing protein [Asbolus verrucosus]
MRAPSLFLVILCVAEIKSEVVEYYWRDYTGLIPEDAMPGGKDINGNDTYIGQVYIHEHGLYVGQIFHGKTEVEVPCYGVKKTDYLIKILCTPEIFRFSWLRTNAETFHVDTINKHAVVAGYDHVNNKGVLNLGRVMHQGILKIGNVAAYDPDTVRLYFPHNDVEKSSKVYEVLMYDKDPLIKPRAKNSV